MKNTRANVLKLLEVMRNNRRDLAIMFDKDGKEQMSTDAWRECATFTTCIMLLTQQSAFDQFVDIYADEMGVAK